MEKIDEHILDILNLDMETYENIRDQLNEKSIGTFVSKNSGMLFSDKEIITSLSRLVNNGYVKATIFNGTIYSVITDGSFDYTDGIIWYRIKGTDKQ